MTGQKSHCEVVCFRSSLDCRGSLRARSFVCEAVSSLILWRYEIASLRSQRQRNTAGLLRFARNGKETSAGLLRAFAPRNDWRKESLRVVVSPPKQSRTWIIASLFPGTAGRKAPPQRGAPHPVVLENGEREAFLAIPWSTSSNFSACFSRLNSRAVALPLSSRTFRASSFCRRKTRA